MAQWVDGGQGTARGSRVTFNMVVPHDDPGIPEDEILIRRINPDQHGAWDEDQQAFRLSSKAFKSSSLPPYGMSVDVRGLMAAAGVDQVEFVTTPVYSGSVSFSVGQLRGANLWVGYDPLEETTEDAANPFHAEVWGNPRPESFTKLQERMLMRHCEWFVQIPDWVIVRPPPERAAA